MMAGGNAPKGREEIVSTNLYYPTPRDVTRSLLSFLNRVDAEPLPGSRIWEPCCGCGMMAEELRARYQVVESDIDPRRGQAQLNFFDATEMLDDTNVIVTNPPFALAERMIRHAWMDLKVDYLALVLKSTFFHAAGRQALFRACPLTYVLPLTWRPDFLGLGRPTMEVSWFVWIRHAGFTHPAYIPLARDPR